MAKIPIIFQKTSDHAVIPTRAYDLDGAWDLALPSSFKPSWLHAGDDIWIDLGFRAIIPRGWLMRIVGRSSTQMFALPGLIDAGYRGQWMVHLHNRNRNSVLLTPGQRVAQCYLVRVQEQMWQEGIVPEDTERGANGFGSSG